MTKLLLFSLLIIFVAKVEEVNSKIVNDISNKSRNIYSSSPTEVIEGNLKELKNRTTSANIVIDNNKISNQKEIIEKEEYPAGYNNQINEDTISLDNGDDMSKLDEAIIKNIYKKLFGKDENIKVVSDTKNVIYDFAKLVKLELLSWLGTQ